MCCEGGRGVEGGESEFDVVSGAEVAFPRGVHSVGGGMERTGLLCNRHATQLL